jgi:hypothetical protein
MVVSLSWYSRYRTISQLPPIPVHTQKHQFSVRNAREYLTNLTTLGPRVTGTLSLSLFLSLCLSLCLSLSLFLFDNHIHSGTRINENDAVHYLIGALHEIKRTASRDVLIEFEVQHPSSFFFLDFLGGMTNVCLISHLFSIIQVYNNITNVVAKISWKAGIKNNIRATLINAHFDSVPGSPGASDDGVGVACMLETLRALSQESNLQQPVIFLFNGAEESMMQVDSVGIRLTLTGSSWIYHSASLGQ